MIVRGFSLIETLIYIALFCLVAIFSYRFFVSNYQAIAKNQQKTSVAMGMYTALARLQADVQMADSAHDSWQQEKEGHIIMANQKNEHIAWFLQNNNLYRKQGKTKSLIAQNIRNFTIKVLKKGDCVKNITCTLSSADLAITHTMRLYNGLL